MTRLSLLLMGLALAGATGCAQCDTCDDFPAPCVGPNCGGGTNGFATDGFIPPTQDGLPADSARMVPPVDDPSSTDNNAPIGNSAPGMGQPSAPEANPGSMSPPAPDQPRN